MTLPDRYSCEQAFRLLDDYIDRELSEEEMQRVREHLAICTLCATEFAFEADMIRALRARIRQVAMPPDLPGRVSTALAAALRAMEGNLEQ